MSAFDDIVAGLEVDVEAAERESSFVVSGRAFLDAISDDTRGDTALTYLITAIMFSSYFLNTPVDELLPEDAFERVYAQLVEHERAAGRV